MNIFDQKLNEYGYYPLTAKEISTLQVNPVRKLGCGLNPCILFTPSKLSNGVNVGYKCNLRCNHCHVEASPDRGEVMSLRTTAKLLNILRENDKITTVDITGGSPELNPYFKYFVKSCADMGKRVIVRSNLAIYTEPGMEDIPELLAENKIKIIASLPCYTEEGVDTQRGKGTYNKAISMFKRLNSLGYGQRGTGLEIDIMFNPAGAAIAPDQHMLENAYKEKIKEMHGITFNHLIALSNMPIGRLGKSMSEDEKKEYLKQLEEKFNPETVKNIMCRHLISISYEGKIYDCDFWQMRNLPIKSKCSHVDNFDYDVLCNREIVTTPLCLMCTAGAGASCSGALT